MQKNRIEIAGNLSAKPDRRFLPSGTKVANARLGENHSYRDKENKLVTQTNWHGLVFYDELADIAAMYEKGDNLFVEGTVEQRKFTPKDGVERTVHEVIVRSCQLIAAPRSRQSNPADTKRSQLSETGLGATDQGVTDEDWPVSAA
jgi:single-strand DNA-binding protein